MRIRMLVSEALRSMTANLSTTMAATLTVLIGMFLVGVLVAFGTWARSWSDDKKDDLLVKVYFCTDLKCGKEATEAQINAVRVKLESNPLVEAGGVRFISKAEAYAKEKKRYPELYEQVPYNPLPHAFEVTPTDGEHTAAVARSLEPLPPGVEKTDYAAKTTSRILDIARVIGYFSWVAVLLLLIAATVLIANTIRLSIFARRREIEVMKLVGASNWFVRGPFMLEGLLCGLAGSIAAVTLLVAAKETILAPILDRLDAGPDVQAWPLHTIALIVCGVGLLLGAAGSGLTVRRFLRV